MAPDQTLISSANSSRIGRLSPPLSSHYVRKFIVSGPLNKYSSHITQPKSQGASQAMLYGTGMTDDDMQKAAGRHRQRVVRGKHLQHAPAGPGRQGEGRGAGGGAGGDAVQYDRRLGRHLDGDRRHELFVAVAGFDCRLDRNRDGGPVVRRLHRPARLRQKHAGLHHGDGTIQSAELMVYGGTIKPGFTHFGGSDQKRDIVIGVSMLRRIPRRQDHRRRTQANRAHQLSRCGGLWRHVHGQHDGLRDRSAGDVAALQFVDPGRRSRQARRMPAGRRCDQDSA